MLYYFRKYPVSLIIVAIIFYLSFFTPPKTDVEEIPYIDKVVHICMYGGLCFILWIEYLRNHKAINWNHVIWGGHHSSCSYERVYRTDASLLHRYPQR